MRFADMLVIRAPCWPPGFRPSCPMVSSETFWRRHLAAVCVGNGDTKWGPERGHDPGVGVRVGL